MEANFQATGLRDLAEVRCADVPWRASSATVFGRFCLLKSALQSIDLAHSGHERRCKAHRLMFCSSSVKQLQKHIENP